ncbi:hypothetical protein CpipJ_CPIJ001691 [Culex quinquefasciatus]|uniref:Uncharacterized protein n=1 Tax=Culex quinquefasciatus TaxID=7176 RepID=B0W3E7_CULQU|nr:hypothetical protein CpipJ_CPIJ001691 [Culex quinquefasciatus]|eukprot:XP_001843231.1 hypothetical protein CpipJ_CPIJ001691 [Culex quinquefasciatus]
MSSGTSRGPDRFVSPNARLQKKAICVNTSNNNNNRKHQTR